MIGSEPPLPRQYVKQCDPTEPKTMQMYRRHSFLFKSVKIDLKIHLDLGNV